MHRFLNRLFFAIENQGFTKKLVEEKHPADEIALALSRANGILSSIANCYDVDKAEFATSAAFVAESVNAAAEILSRAHENLAELNSNYSLDRLDDQDLVVSLPLHNAAAEPEVAEIERPKRSDFSLLSEKLDTILTTMTEATPNPIDQPARTYDELLHKLTSLKDAASSNANDQDIIPMLEGLRTDLLHIRSVA